MAEMTYEDLLRALVDAQRPPNHPPGVFTFAELCEIWGCRRGRGRVEVERLRRAGRIVPCWAAYADDWGVVQQRKAYRVVAAPPLEPGHTA